MLLEAFDERDLSGWTGCFAGWARESLLAGVNSRDLATLQVVPSRLEQLASRLPRGIPRVAESGVGSAEDARRVAEAGYDLALVGSALMSGNDPAALAGAMLSAARTARASAAAGERLMWIKICGITTAQAVEAALAARVDAIGFVFADSPRQLTLEDAVALAAPARGQVRCVAVTRHPSQRYLDDILAVFRPDMLQTDTEDLRELQLPQQLELLPVFRGWDPQQGKLPARAALRGARRAAAALRATGPARSGWRAGLSSCWPAASTPTTWRRRSARFGLSGSMSRAEWRSGPA